MRRRGFFAKDLLDLPAPARLAGGARHSAAQFRIFLARSGADRRSSQGGENEPGLGGSAAVFREPETRRAPAAEGQHPAFSAATDQSRPPASAVFRSAARS